jgi:hypothetical protein
MYNIDTQLTHCMFDTAYNVAIVITCYIAIIVDNIVEKLSNVFVDVIGVTM